ncbi:MAG: exopolysaccharide biosynthesis protein [Firmicutes bacterium]|nr:exopolysaccharide biosynthesis protein [Bacillota bacterium]
MAKKYDHHISFSEVLSHLARAMPPDGLTLRQLIHCLRDRGMLLLCMVLTVPFLLPVSIPGSSTPFGLAIVLIALGVITGRPPWLPGRFVDRTIPADSMLMVLEKGAALFARIERWTKPRLPLLTRGKTMRLVNGLLLIFSAILLMAPLPLPFSNTLPAYGVLFIAAGSLERDGYLLVLGYLMIFLSVLYFALLALLGAAGLQMLFTRL